MSFRRFLGLSLEDASPDHTTLCRFRNRLAEAGLAEKLLWSSSSAELEQHGLNLKRGTMIDATLVETRFRPERLSKPGGARRTRRRSMRTRR